MVFQIDVANVFSGVAKVLQIQELQRCFNFSGVANVFECGVCKGISDWYLQRCSYFEKHLNLKPKKLFKLKSEKCLKLKSENHLKAKFENQI